MLYMTVVVLGENIGFTFTLAGIAGAIVAIGITADSFIIYFERLRDEIREGRSLRSAVEMGWQRARRTIIISDIVSLIAALLLYIFAIGNVRGFAFALGLTTVIDLIIVFLFTKPIITVMANLKFFRDGNPMSGLNAHKVPGAVNAGKNEKGSN
jgi:preprotein translocase subunit SecD